MVNFLSTKDGASKKRIKKTPHHVKYHNLTNLKSNTKEEMQSLLYNRQKIQNSDTALGCPPEHSPRLENLFYFLFSLCVI